MARRSLVVQLIGRQWAPRFPFHVTEMASVVRYNPRALEQFVGRERRERVSHPDWSGDA
jgi:hypothetical protein